MTPALPSPAYRVGITGTRVLPPALQPLLSAQLAQVLDLVKAAAPPEASLRLLSPLALGADRLAASLAIDRGWRLVVPMPFAQPEYEADFPDAVEAFRALLQDAEPLELDGRRDDAERAYEACGRFVARNCDLLIAIWDGTQGRGRGGTAEIVAFAGEMRLPVWWIDASGAAPPRLIRAPRDMRGREPDPRQSETALQALVSQAMSRPLIAPPRFAGLIGRIVLAVCRLLGRTDDPLAHYLAPPALPDRRVWRLFRGFFNLIAPRSRLPDPRLPRQRPPDAPPGPIGVYWHRFLMPADTMSQAYGDRHRSSFMLVFMLAAAAALAEFLRAGLPPGWDGQVAQVQALLFALVMAMVVICYLRHFHERWIACRLLAELCRVQGMLALLGWSLPHAASEHLAHDRHHLDGGLPRDGWVAWYFAAACRAAPLPQGRLGAAEINAAARFGHALARSQIAYHTIRQTRCERAALWLAHAAELTFLATFIVMLAKATTLQLGWTHIAYDLGLFRTLPAATAAFLGIRSYAEFQQIGHQSRRMRAVLAEIEPDLALAVADETISSQIVAQHLHALAMAMLGDAGGWAQLFRPKGVHMR